ncbi:PASTA domain-containing protein [Streptomyces sp. E11-3]|uniref:PASTA domain-containing protein n=1 Tax=Streptomyces sp. E11-3 TaxID=3110112 RepID=UPI00397F45FE
MKSRFANIPIAVTVAAAVAVLGACAAPVDGKNPAAGSTPSAADSATAPTLAEQTGEALDDAVAAARDAGLTASSHDASDLSRTPLRTSAWTVCFEERTAKTVDFGVVRAKEPCPAKDKEPIPWPTLPDLVGLTTDKAAAKLRAEGIRSAKLRIVSPFKDVTVPAEAGDWTVCFTDPEAGADITSAVRVIELEAVKPETSCPKTSGGYLDRTNDPDYKPAPKPTPTPTPTPKPARPHRRRNPPPHPPARRRPHPLTRRNPATPVAPPTASRRGSGPVRSAPRTGPTDAPPRAP